MFKCLGLTLLALAVSVAAGFEVPEAEFKVFYPKGFDVSIPAAEGVSFFAFHGNLNDVIGAFEVGRWAGDIVKPKNGRFTFEERETTLKLGEKIYYWAYVTFNGRGYRKNDGLFVVTKYDGMAPDQTATAPRGPSVTTAATPPEECNPSITTTGRGVTIPCAGQIIFEENFNGNELDTEKWQTERRFSKEPDHEFVMYLNEEVLKVQGGMATIKPVATTKIYGDDILKKELDLGLNCTGLLESLDCKRDERFFDILPPLISAQFSTKNSFSFKYGRVEIRAKMPNGPWVFPQLFLLPVQNRYGASDYQSGQLRVAMSRNNGGHLTDDLFGGMILNAKEPFRYMHLCKKPGPPTDWSSDFHIYTLEWQTDRITLSLDNEDYCTVGPKLEGLSNLSMYSSLPNKKYLENGTLMAPFDQQFYIVLGYGVGGHNDFPDKPELWSKRKPWPNYSANAMARFWRNQRDVWLNSDSALTIDYVRVYSV